MNESLRSMKPSLKDGPGSSDELAEQRLYISNFDDHHSYPEAVTHNLNNWEALHRHFDPFSLHSGGANEIDQVNVPSIGFDITEVTALDPPPPGYTSRPTRRKDDVQILEAGCAFYVEEPPMAPMLPSQPPASRPSSGTPQTLTQHYEPFLGRFSNSEQAKTYRRNKMRFGRLPWRDPESDPTIAETENNRDFHVERIYNAMVCGDFARDNANSTALKRWVYGAHYQSDLIEAYAHKVFDCLLEQVKKGFRGWHQNDYVNDERKGDDDDKGIDCAGRLDNIITALQQKKSICENVMSSAWQIRMFVNAPKAYAKRKDQNRVGNSKRPNTKGCEAAEYGPRPSKRSRNTATTGSKPIRDGSVAPQSRVPATTALQRPHKRLLQLASNSSPGTNATSGISSMSPSPIISVGSSGQQTNNALLLPTLSPPVLRISPQHNFQHGISTPSVQQRHPLPPLSPYGNLPGSSTPDIMPPLAMAPNFSSWLVESDLDFSPSASSPSGLTTNAVFEEPQQDIQQFPLCYAVEDANIFDGPTEGAVNLLDVELVPSSGINEGLQDDFFDGFWGFQQTDVLQVPDATEKQQYP